LANAETEIFAPGRDNNPVEVEVENTFRAQHLTFSPSPSRFPAQNFHPEFACLSAISASNSSLLLWLPFPLLSSSYFLNAFLLFNFKLRLQFYFAFSTLSLHLTPPFNLIFLTFSQLFSLFSAMR